MEQTKTMALLTAAAAFHQPPTARGAGNWGSHTPQQQDVETETEDEAEVRRRERAGVKAEWEGQPTGLKQEDESEDKAEAKVDVRRVRRAKQGPRYWTLEEDRALCRAVRAVGREGWHAVVAHAADVLAQRRTAEQCCHRWHRVLNPHIRRCEWTPDEDRLLRLLVRTHGATHWKRMAHAIPGRTDQQCRYRWHQIADVDADADAGASANPGANPGSNPKAAPARPRMHQRAAHARRDYCDRTVATQAGFTIDVWHLRPQANALAIEAHTLAHTLPEQLPQFQFQLQSQSQSQSHPQHAPSIHDYVDMPTKVGRAPQPRSLLRTRALADSPVHSHLNRMAIGNLIN